MKKECSFRKQKYFRFFKSILYKNGEAANMPVVASRLVTLSVQIFEIIQTHYEDFDASGHGLQVVKFSNTKQLGKRIF